MTKLSIILVTVLGFTLLPFRSAEAGAVQNPPGLGSAGQDDEQAVQFLEELLQAADADAADSTATSDAEDDDDAEGRGPGSHGNAYGVQKKLKKAGSSAGVAKGDFNGDGFADLAVGVPSEDIVRIFVNPITIQNLANAGAVNVIYGSAGGLTATNAAVPTNQFWSQLSAGVLGDPGENDSFGAAVAAGDFNGDGFSDLAIAIPNEPSTIPGTTTTVRGAVQVLYGSASGLTDAGNQLIALPALFGTAGTESALRVGNALVWGNFNGDGFGDLAVEGQNNNGPDIARLSVLFGSAAGLNRGVVRKEFPFPNAVSNGGGELFGTDMALAAGKLNGDQFDDIVVGLPDENVGTALDAGAVHILFGSATGPTTAGSQVFNQDSRQDIFEVPDLSESFDHFGQAVAVGDFNLDGFADLAVGVPFEDIASSGGTLNAIPDAGVVHIFFGTSSGLVIIGSQFFQQGSTAAVTGQGEKRAEANDRFGSALAAGDFNADAVADLAIGAPGETLSGFANAGAVTVLYGVASSGLSTTAGPGEQFWTESSVGATPAAGDSFGVALTAWNFGRNQIVTFPQFRVVSAPDLAIGIPGKDVNGQTDAGAVRVIYGSIGGLSTATVIFGGVGPSELWTQDSTGVLDQAETGDRFGSALY